MMKSPLLPAIAAMILSVAGPCAAQTPVLQDKGQVQKELWSKEQAIYAARGRGDLQVYYNGTSPEYLGWPPQVAAPIGREKLAPANPGVMGSHEKLEMKFTSLTLSGDTALIYYKTHMTVQGDGTPTDKHYEVIHAWVREGGQWRLLGGMARPSVDR
jgi:ketosteroid isomerase-like protein